MSQPSSPAPANGLPLTSPLLWTLWALVAVAVLVEAVPAAQTALVYDRAAVLRGEIWRLWTGHLTHFGWPHLVADGALLAILALPLARRHARFTWFALGAMPLAVSLWLLWGEPEMARYGGLSAFNLGLLFYVALQGWQRNWTDWFWPAVLAVYVIELGLEIARGGTGGGMIAFNEPDIRVATGAHLAATAYAVAAWLDSRRRRAARPSAP